MSWLFVLTTLFETGNILFSGSCELDGIDQIHVESLCGVVTVGLELALPVDDEIVSEQINQNDTIFNWKFASQNV